jgi:hypothetical protein
MGINARAYLIRALIKSKRAYKLGFRQRSVESELLFRLRVHRLTVPRLPVLGLQKGAFWVKTAFWVAFSPFWVEGQNRKHEDFAG